MREQLSRRGFLVAAAAASGAAIAAGGLSACTPKVPTGNGGSEAALAGAAGGSAADGASRPSWLTPPAPIADGDISAAYDCEILVIGAGSAGVAAASYASAQGAKTVVMTKGSGVEKLGFNVGAWNSAHDAEFGISYDPIKWRQTFNKAYGGRCNTAMLGNIFDKSGGAMDWFAEYMSDVAPYYRTSDTGLMGMFDVPASNVVYVWLPEGATPADFELMEVGIDNCFQAARDRFEEKGGIFLGSTPAVQLLTAGGRVSGAVGKTAEGAYVKVTASQGVVLACGDIVSDDEMLQYFCPVMAGLGSRNGFGTCTGDGVKMGIWAGAKVQTGPWCPSQAYPHGDIIAAGPDAPVVNWFFSSFPWLRVNSAGHRFVDESVGADPLWGSSNLLMANAEQPGHSCWAICDAGYPALTDPDPRGLTDLFKMQVANGTIIQADSLEALATAAGIDATTLAATVERYNGFAAAGADADFGAPADALIAVKQAPFFALKFVPYNSVAVGGLMTDEFLRVVDSSDKVIDGLYAVGNMIGGRAGFQYIDSLVGAGSMKTTAMAGGIIAVKHILGAWEQPF
jgi:succinate dehydrogenase/fumarate reductase flavoprotein subunit